MKIEVSNGELVDKVTILTIKLEKIKSPAKLANIRREVGPLQKAMHAIGIDETDKRFTRLLQINYRLWEIEDTIREKEQHKEFDEAFIQLARQVYHENDRRSAVKREINLSTGSSIIEEKQYADYDKHLVEAGRGNAIEG